MKREIRFKILSILSIIFLILGCSPENDALSTPEPSQVLPRFFTHISGSYPKSFEAGDIIGIFPVRYENELPGIPGNINDPANIGFTYDGIMWEAESGREFYIDEVPVDIYAYYPYDEEMGVTSEKSTLSAYPFDLSGDQNLKDADFLWAKTEQVSSGNRSVGLAFQHLMSRIEINLQYETPEDNPDVSVHNVQTTALVDLSRGIALPQDDIKETIIPKLLSGESGDVLFSYEAIIVPQSMAAGTPFLTIDYDGEKLLFALPADIEFEPGYSYVFNLTLETAKESRRLLLTKDCIIK